MATEPVSLSYDDLLALEGDAECVRQLIEGTVVVAPAPSTRHQIVLMALSIQIGGHVKAQGLGTVLAAPVDVVLRAPRPGNVFQPDFLFITRERQDIVKKGWIEGGPDLVVEILSPSTAYLDVGVKKAAYARAGVREYWIIPSEFDRVEVMKLAEGGRFAKPILFEPGETLTTDLLPGLALSVAELFPA